MEDKNEIDRSIISQSVCLSVRPSPSLSVCVHVCVSVMDRRLISGGDPVNDRITASASVRPVCQSHRTTIAYKVFYMLAAALWVACLVVLGVRCRLSFYDRRKLRGQNWTGKC